MARNTQPPKGESDVPDDPDGDLTPNQAREDLGLPASSGPDLDELTVKELEAKADITGVDVEGTGKDGNVLKADLVEALENAPELPAGRPSLIALATSAAATPTPERLEADADPDPGSGRTPGKD